MEDKKTHPSLPSNYVSLAQLQERWLKEKERQQREKEQQEQEERKLQQKKLEEDQQRQNKSQRPPRRGHRILGDAVRSETGNRNAKHYQPKVKNVSDNNQPAVKARRENREKSKDKVEGDQNDEQKQGSESKKSKSMQRKANRKPRAEKEVTVIADCNTEVTREEDKGLESIEVIKGNEKEKIKSESNDKNDGLAEEVEEKIGDLSINSDKRHENGRFWRPYNRIRGPQRNSGGGGRYGGHGPYRGRRYEDRRHPGTLGYQAPRKRRDDNMVWVKKGGSSEGNVCVTSGS